MDTLTDCYVFIHRWATQGFDFLQAIEPAFISALPEDDFLVKNNLLLNPLSLPTHLHKHALNRMDLCIVY